MIQVTVLRITGYGPWTLELGYDREHELQMLQASLYRRIQGLFSERGCLAFMNRGDEYFAVTNGLGAAAHADIQRGIRSEFDLPVAMSVGAGDTPYMANVAAFEARRSGVFSDAEHAVYGSPVGDGGAPGEVTVMHMDVEDLTSSAQKKSPYDITNAVFSLYARMSGFFLGRGGMAFFLGGDNFMVVADGATARGDAEEFVVEAARAGGEGGGIALNCGIGRAPASREAARLATGSLDEIRRIRDSGGAKPSVYEMSCC